ncbi:MAG TPA: FtsX-like permease family protein [Actinomycetota bacterium]
MRLALAEIGRAKLRFALLTGAVALLVFLILFQQSLAGTLLGTFTGGLEHQSATVLVYGADARRSVEGSRVTPDQVAAVADVPDVAEAGPIGVSTFTADVDGELVDATVFGYALGGPGEPTTLVDGRYPRADGEAVASSADAADGFAIGATVTIVPGDVPITVVGLADDLNFNVQPTVFVSYPTYEELVLAGNPDARGVLPSIVGAETVAGAEPEAVAADVGAAVADVDAVDRATAVTSLPGVSSIQQSFAIILGLAFVVVVLLTGFFFLIITVQKLTALTLLRAVGASSGYLLRNLVAQVVIVIAAGVAIAVGLLLVAARAATTDVFEVRADPGVIAITAAAILALGLVASVASMRRVARIDPATATTRTAGGGLA